MEDFQHKYLTDKPDDSSPDNPNFSGGDSQFQRRARLHDHFYQVVERESPLVCSSEDFSNTGIDPRRQFLQRNPQLNQGQYDARNKAVGLQQNQGKTQQLTNDSSLTSYKTNMVASAKHQKAVNPKSQVNKTQTSGQHSTKSACAPQLPQKTKSEPISAVPAKANGQTGHLTIQSPSAFAKAKESMDKHVTIDLYQAVYGDESTFSHRPALSQTELPIEQSKSVQNFNSQNNTGTNAASVTVPVSSTTSIKVSPTRKRHSGLISPISGNVPSQYLGNFKMPQSKYAKSSVFKTRNTKVKANTIIAQIQSMDDGTDSIRSPVRQKTMNFKSEQLQNIMATMRSKNVNNMDEKIKQFSKGATKKPSKKQNQPKLFESTSKGRIAKQLSPVNSNPSASLQAHQLGPAKLTNNSRKNMKSQEYLNQQKNGGQAPKQGIVLKQHQSKKSKHGSSKGTNGVTPKSSLYRGTDHSQSNRNSKSPILNKRDKISFSNSNVSNQTRQDKLLHNKILNNAHKSHHQLQNIDSSNRMPQNENSQHQPDVNPKLTNQTAFSASVARCQPSQKKSQIQKQGANRPRVDLEDNQQVQHNTVSLVQQEWQQSKMQMSTGPENFQQNGQRPPEIRDVHIQEVDDPTEFNLLNRTNGQDNEKTLKLSSINAQQLQQNQQLSHTVILQSPTVINSTSEQRSQVTLFNPQATNGSAVSPLPMLGVQSQVKKNGEVQPSGGNQAQFMQGKPTSAYPYQKSRESYLSTQQIQDQNLGAVHLNNYLNGETNTNFSQQRLKTESHDFEIAGDNGFRLSAVAADDERNKKVKSAMIVLSGQKMHAASQNKLNDFAQSQSKSLSDHEGPNEKLQQNQNLVQQNKRINENKPILQNNQVDQKTVIITQEGDFVQALQDNSNQKLSPSMSYLTTHGNNQTAHFKMTASKHGTELQQSHDNPAPAPGVHTQPFNYKKHQKNDSSNSLVIIDGVESPIPKIMNETAGNGSRPSGGGFGLHNICNLSDNNQHQTQGANSSHIPRSQHSQVSHEGGSCNTQTQKGPLSRLTPSPRLNKLPKKNQKRGSQHLSKEGDDEVKTRKSNVSKGQADRHSKKTQSSEQTLRAEGGKFGAAMGSTVKKSPQYQDPLQSNNEQNLMNNKNNQNSIIVPELDLSPRDDQEEFDIETVKNNQRKLFENIQAQYVNNNSINQTGMNNSKQAQKSHSSKMDDKLLQNNGAPSNSNSCQSHSNVQHTVNMQKRKLMKKSSLLAKSLVEDASEDFSNIEEHISTFYNQHTLQTGQLTVQGLGTTQEEDYKQIQESLSEQQSKDKLLSDKFKNAFQSDVVSRTQAQRHDLQMSTNFGSTLDNQMQYDENENNVFMKNAPLSCQNKNQNLLGASHSTKIKHRMISQSNSESNQSHASRSIPSSKQLCTLQSVQRVNHNANNISLNYGRQVPKTLFGKVIHSMNTSQYHGQRFSNVSSAQGPATGTIPVNTHAANTYYGSDSREPSVRHQIQNQKASHKQSQSQADLDMRDSCREVTSCQNSNIFCGYQTGRSCGLSNESQVLMEHQVQIDPSDLDRSNKPKNEVKSAFTYPERKHHPQPSPTAQLQKKKERKGISDLVTSVPMGQSNNKMLMQVTNTQQKQIKPETKMNASDASAPATSPHTKGTASAYSPEAAQELTATQNNKPQQTPSSFDNNDISEAVKDHRNEGSSTQRETKEHSKGQKEAAQQQAQSQSESDLHKNHLIQTMQSLHYMKMASPPDPKVIADKSVVLPPSPFKKTLIFDLDETLVHCVDDIDNLPYDLPISVQFQQGERIDAGINVRPYVYDCLKQAKKFYQVVIFTASHKSYADAVLDTLEEEFRRDVYLTEEERMIIESKPEKDRKAAIQELKRDQKLIDYRLYREHCYKTSENVFIKDLRILKNKDLSQVLIVDNAVYSFGFQLSNGIPIIPFYDSHSTNINDEELVHLVYYFSCIVESEDVRVQNKRAFQLEELKMMDIAQQLRNIQNGTQATAAVRDDDSAYNGDGRSDIDNDSNQHDGYDSYGNDYANARRTHQQYQAYKQNVNDLGQKRGSDNPNRGYEHNGTIPEQEEEDEDEESLMNQNNKAQRERRKKAAQIVTQTSLNSSQVSSNKKMLTPSQPNSLNKK